MLVVISKYRAAINIESRVDHGSLCFQACGYYLLICSISKDSENMATMIQCPTAVSYTSLTVDKIIIMKPCLKATREGAGEKLVMLERVFFPLNFRVETPRPAWHKEKALTMSIDKYAEIAGKIWLYGWDISL